MPPVLPILLMLVQLTGAQKPTLAVVELEGRNISTPNAQLLTDRLSHELIVLGKFTIVERGEMDAILKEQGFQQSGCTSQECVVEMGQLIGARYMVAGSVGRLGTMFIMNVRVVDVKSAEVVRAAQATVEGAIEELVKTGIPDVARQLAGKAKVVPKPGEPGRPVAPVPAPKGMVWIPGGTFSMGTATAMLARGAPLHDVYVDGFFMDTCEVTQQQYRKEMGQNPAKRKCPTCPVTSATWSDAREYCRRLGKRLPTEAEWEKACKAGSKADHPWGSTSDMVADHAWYMDNASVKILGTLRTSQGARPVAQKKPNAYGLYDMLGNVTEFTHDVWDRHYYEKSPSRNPKGPASGTYHVLRGGYYQTEKKFTNCVKRFVEQAGIKRYLTWTGFRCVKSVKR